LSGLSFLTPLGALVAVAVVLPLAGFVLFERRAERVRAILHLPEPSRGARATMIVSLTLIAALLGVAAAQPVLRRTTPRTERMDAQAYVVFDVSRSMEARRAGGRDRLERAKRIALRVRSALPDIPFGVASFAIFALPHLFPTSDAQTFAATVRDAVRIGSPPSPNVFSGSERTTDLSAISILANGFFAPHVTRGLVIVFTDGESNQFFAGDVANAYRHKIRLIFVQVWDPQERIYLGAGDATDPGYRPDPAGSADLAALALATRGDVFSEQELGAIISRARADLGSGPTRRLSSEPGRTPLAPWILCVAFVPLGIVLRRRNL